MSIENCVGFAVKGTIGRRTDAIAETMAWMMQKRRTKESIAVGEPSDVDQVIHPTGHYRIDGASVGMSAVQV
jgi:hypothetical protein